MSALKNSKCDFLYDLSQLSRRDLKKTIKETSGENLIALTELLVNADLFAKVKHGFKLPKNIKKLRAKLLQNIGLIKLLLSIIFKKIISCETLGMCAECESE